MSLPLISIVITTYRRPKLLKNAIKSAVNQTYQNIEIIVVDDNEAGSTYRKETSKTVKGFKNIRYINNMTSLGGAISRNVGITHAKGEYIAFLDDDDLYMPAKIQKQYEKFVDTAKFDDHIGLVYAYCDAINSSSQVTWHYNNDYEGIPIYEHMMGCLAGTSLWFSSKKTLLECGMFDDSPSKQDSILLLKMLVRGYSVYRIPETLVLYREHSGNGISGTKPSNIEGIKLYRDLCRKHYDALASADQVADIEYNFSKTLVSLYALNDMRRNSLCELTNMFKNGPLKLENFVAFLKFLAPNAYKRYIQGA